MRRKVKKSSMSDFVIRKGTERDIPAVAEIYDRILDIEECDKATIGWQRGIYPTEATARAALEVGDLFVLEQESKICAAARINRVQVPDYARANWAQKDAPDEKIMVLHTLVVDPLCGGRGLGTAFVRFYEDYALRHGCPYLRMDTNARNLTARRLYARLGYTEADILPCEFNGIPGVQLVCLEKTL